MKAQATNGRAAGKIIRCMLAALLVAAAVFAGLPSRSQAAYAADGSLSDATWEEVKGGIEDLMGTPYVWEAKAPRAGIARGSSAGSSPTSTG